MPNRLHKIILKTAQPISIQPVILLPNIVFVEKYKDDAREISIYDDIAGGIAFDIVQAGRQQICTGIIVHEPGKPVNDVYIRLQAPKDINK